MSHRSLARGNHLVTTKRGLVPREAQVGCLRPLERVTLRKAGEVAADAAVRKERELDALKAAAMKRWERDAKKQRIEVVDGRAAFHALFKDAS